jgi:hypothetical protein
MPYIPPQPALQPPLSETTKVNTKWRVWCPYFLFKSSLPGKGLSFRLRERRAPCPLLLYSLLPAAVRTAAAVVIVAPAAVIGIVVVIRVPGCCAHRFSSSLRKRPDALS